MTVSSYLFFQKLGFVEDSLSILDIEITDVISEGGQEIVIPLGDYNFDLLIYNDGIENQYLIPFHLINLLFTNSIYYLAYYNGDEILGADVFQDPAPVAESTLNGETIPYNIKVASYNLLILSLDYFSSIKEYKEVESYKECMSWKAYDIITSADADYYLNLSRFIYGLDDFHAFSASQGYYHEDPTLVMPIVGTNGPRKSAYSQAKSAYDNLLWEKFGDSINDPEQYPTVRILEDNKTAILYFYAFTYDMPSEFKTRLNALPASIENVVVDVTYNTGGDVGAIFRMLGYMTDDPIIFHTMNPKDQSSMTYVLEDSYTAFDFNWYISTSKISFSAANIFAMIASENNIATIIGQHSFGGSSATRIVVLPCGYTHTLSSYSSFYYGEGNLVDGYELTSIEEGFEVDYTITVLTDDQKIIDAINSHQASE